MNTFRDLVEASWAIVELGELKVLEGAHARVSTALLMTLCLTIDVHEAEVSQPRLPAEHALRDSGMDLLT